MPKRVGKGKATRLRLIEQYRATVELRKTLDVEIDLRHIMAAVAQRKRDEADKLVHSLAAILDSVSPGWSETCHT